MVGEILLCVALMAESPFSTKYMEAISKDKDLKYFGGLRCAEVRRARLFKTFGGSVN